MRSPRPATAAGTEAGACARARRLGRRGRGAGRRGRGARRGGRARGACGRSSARGGAGGAHRRRDVAVACPSCRSRAGRRSRPPARTACGLRLARRREPGVRARRRLERVDRGSRLALPLVSGASAVAAERYERARSPAALACAVWLVAAVSARCPWSRAVFSSRTTAGSALRNAALCPSSRRWAPETATAEASARQARSDEPATAPTQATVAIPLVVGADEEDGGGAGARLRPVAPRGVVRPVAGRSAPRRVAAPAGSSVGETAGRSSSAASIFAASSRSQSASLNPASATARSATSPPAPAPAGCPP